MAAPDIYAPLQVANFRVEVPSLEEGGFSMPRIALRDRRGRGHVIVHWCFQRHLEMLLYNRFDGGTSGPIYKLLHKTGLHPSAFHVARRSVDQEDVTGAEFDALLALFKASLPFADPTTINRTRSMTLLPVATAAAMVRSFGDAPASLAFLRAFAQPVPRAWELKEEQERLAADCEVDLLIEEELADATAFEVEEKSFAQELTEMAVFSADGDDEKRMTLYALQRPSVTLQRQLDAYIAFRTQALNARRSGNAVVSGTAESDRQSLLRFLGFLSGQHANLVPANVPLDLTLLTRPDLGDFVQAYAEFLQERQRLKYSSIANYANGLASVVSYAYESGAFEVPAEVTQAERTPLSQILNLRNQAEKQSRTQQLYDKRIGGFLTWEEAQQARVKAVKAVAAYKGSDHRARSGLMRDAVAVSLLTLIPPDRVGVIRKLRIGHTLCRHEGGGWGIDLSKVRGAHKTAKWYGPYSAKLPEALWGSLDAYAAQLAFAVGGEQAYLFHPVHGGVDRPLESSAWTLYIKRLFKRLHGAEIAPKTLRSAFITWLRDSTDCPAILSSAAHAMKHRVATQASDHYDANADGRLVEAAFEFNASYAANFSTPAVPMPPRPTTPRPAAATAGAATVAPQGVALPGLLARRAANEQQPSTDEDVVVFHVEVPWSDALVPGRQIEIRPVRCSPASQLPTRFTIPDDRVVGQALRIQIKLTKNVAGERQRIHIVGAAVLGENPPPPRSAEERLVEPAAEVTAEEDDGFYEIECVEDVRRDARSRREILVKWAGTDAEGEQWPSDWISYAAATPSAQREARALEARKKKGAAEAASSSDGQAAGRVEPEAASSSRSEHAEHEGEQVQRLLTHHFGPHAHNVALTQAEVVATAWTRAQEGFDTLHGAASNATDLVTVREGQEHTDEVLAQAVAEQDQEAEDMRKRAAQPATAAARETRRRRGASGSSSEGGDTPTHEGFEDEMDVGSYQLGQTVLVHSIGPQGKEWFRSKVVGFRSRWPPMMVEFEANEAGLADALLLPQVRKAYVWAANVKPLPADA